MTSGASHQRGSLVPLAQTAGGGAAGSRRLFLKESPAFVWFWGREGGGRGGERERGRVGGGSRRSDRGGEEGGGRQQRKIIALGTKRRNACALMHFPRSVLRCIVQRHVYSRLPSFPPDIRFTVQYITITLSFWPIRDRGLSRSLSESKHKQTDITTKYGRKQVSRRKL